MRFAIFIQCHLVQIVIYAIFLIWDYAKSMWCDLGPMLCLRISVIHTFSLYSSKTENGFLYLRKTNIRKYGENVRNKDLRSFITLTLGCMQFMHFMLFGFMQSICGEIWVYAILSILCNLKLHKTAMRFSMFCN